MITQDTLRQSNRKSSIGSAPNRDLFFALRPVGTTWYQKL
jgi:hypothetical protein